MAITYRMHTHEDEAALIRLWCEHSGWDQVSAETWAYRLLHPPFGEAAIAVAEDQATGAIVGQFAFIPAHIVVDGRELRAVRPFAPILNLELRTPFWSVNPLKHPIAELYLHATRALRQRGIDLFYMVPDPRWRRLLRLLPMLTTGSLPLWSLPLPLAAPLPMPAGYTAAPIDAFDERVDRLWESASRLHPCMIVRDARTLRWKVGNGDYQVTAVERAGELVGLVASRHKGDRQWLICDLLTADADESLRATLIAVTNLAQAQALAAPPDKPFHKVALLVTPAIEPAVRSLGFARDSYNFPLVIHVLNPEIAKESVAPGRWYLSAND